MNITDRKWIVNELHPPEIYYYPTYMSIKVWYEATKTLKEGYMWLTIENKH